MRHLVLTRSVYGPGWTHAENQRRLNLTARVTVPSLRAQTCRDFEWIVLLDRDDPLQHTRKATMRQLGAPVRFIYFTSAAHPDAERARIAALGYKAGWGRAVGQGEGVTLTTRLDDDDGFAADALERIQAAAEPDHDERVVLMLPEGHRYHEGKVEPVTHERNAWATLQAPAGDGAVIYSFNHKRIADHVPVHMVDRQPAWLWMRHPDTLSNHRRASEDLTSEVRSLYPIKWEEL